jgi:hypothetical protein
MNAKSLTIGGAFVLLAVTLIGRFNGLITDDFLIIAAIVVFFACLSYIVSWGATQAYKVLYHKRSTWNKDTIKRKIYRCALYNGAGTMLLCGSFFLLADDLTTQEKIVVGIFWLLACAFVGLSSPLVWRWTFDKLLPRFNRYVSGKKDNYGNENEAMDRPSEVPRE